MHFHSNTDYFTENSPNDFWDNKILQEEVSRRTVNICLKNGILTVYDLACISEEEFQSINKVGPRTIKEANWILNKYGITFSPVSLRKLALKEETTLLLLLKIKRSTDETN